LNTTSIRVLVVDDYEAWRRFVCSTCQQFPQLGLVAEASDGLEALQKAKELQPDLIVLDIGLPNLNGIQAAHRIRETSPNSKILFVSENRSFDVVKEALRTGACGYVVKSDAGSDLLLAVEAVLQGKRFVSASVAYDWAHATADRADNAPEHDKAVAPFRAQKSHRHEVEFYADDAEFVDGFARFIEAALTAGSAVIVVTTDSHHASLR
jgi:DNA-binding NarL/FixJ family response regulator